MNAPHILSNDPLAHAVFEKLRRNGHAHTDGQTIRIDGREYGITAHDVCTLQLVHVIIEHLDGPTMGNERAMAVLEVSNNGYHTMDGTAHLMPALLNGLVIKDQARPAQHSYHVLPWVEVPPVDGTSWPLRDQFEPGNPGDLCPAFKPPMPTLAGAVNVGHLQGGHRG